MSSNVQLSGISNVRRSGSRSVEEVTAMAPVAMAQTAMDLVMERGTREVPSSLERRTGGEATRGGEEEVRAEGEPMEKARALDMVEAFHSLKLRTVEWWNRRSATLSLSRHANRFLNKWQDRNVQEVVNQSAILSRDRCLRNNAETFQGSNVTTSPSNSATVFRSNSASKFPGSSARVYPSNNAAMFQDNNAGMFQNNSAEMSPGSSAATFLNKSVGMFPGSSVPMSLNRNAGMYPDSSVVMFLARTAEMFLSRSAEV